MSGLGPAGVAGTRQEQGLPLGAMALPPPSPATALPDARECVLVTGRAGMIGGALAAWLAPHYRVLGLDRGCGGLPDCAAVDLADPASIAAALGPWRARGTTRIASVVHLAAYFDMSGEPNPLYRRVNIDGTRHLLQVLQQQGFEVEQFVYASTMLVHAPTEPGHPIDEAAPLDPKWIYPRSKLDAENVVRTCHGRIPIVVLRIAGVYDDGCHSQPIAQQIHRIDTRAPTAHVFPGDPERGQAFVHLDDLCDAIARAIARRAGLPPDLTLLIGEPEVTTYGELQRRFARLLHGEDDWSTRSVPKPLAQAGAWLQDVAEAVVPDAIDQGEGPFIKPFMVELADDHFEIDPARALQTLGWRPRHRLRDALPQMVQALRSDPAGWRAQHHLGPAADTPKRAPAPAAPAPAAAPARAAAAVPRRGALPWWAVAAQATLGSWLLAAPATLGFGGEAWLAASDILCGLAAIALGLASLLPRHAGWARLGTAFIGAWLLMAPLLAWTGSAAAYASDTLAGTLLLALAALAAPWPAIAPAAEAGGPDIPPGWDYSPSDVAQRLPVIALAWLGFLLSRYLSAWQLGHIDTAWDPFFGDGTERIIDSWLSRAFPVSDAGLGAVSYLIEALSGAMGDRRRWRTMPWLVVLFGLLVVPLGAVSIFFIIIQPIWFGTWCTICLVTCAAMLLMIPYSLDEIVATGQFLAERRRAGRSLWQVFWHGDTMPGGRRAERTEAETPLADWLTSMWRGGVDMTWGLNACAAIGVLLMFSRPLLGNDGALAASDHLVGSLVIVVAVSAWAEVTRALRYLIVPLGAWLVASPWWLDGAGGPGAAFALVLAGVALVGLSLPRGPVRSHYGTWRWALR